MSATSRPISACQICAHRPLSPVLFLGYLPPVNTMPAIGSAAEEGTVYPLELLRCPACSLVQIGTEVAAEVLFPYSYPYLSGTTRVLRDNFADLCAETRARLPLGPGDLVVDIGSNDGSLLINFAQAGLRVLGIEPSQAGEVARARGVETHRGYFDAATVDAVLARHGPARVVTAANVFAHIADPHAVMAQIDRLLAQGGLFVSESHYLLSLVETLQYDTIYHEHLRYYHLGALAHLLGRHGFAMVHARRIPTHGGSVRVYAARRGEHRVAESVAALRLEEAAAGLDDGSGLVGFRARVIASRRSLLSLLAALPDRARVWGVGAPSRASTLIGYTGVDDGTIEAVAEVAGSHKLGRYVPGTRIPVVDEARLVAEQPEYALLFSWHIAEELLGNLRRRGFRGRCIVPLPVPRVVD